ncbi:DNA-binding transcriptional MerR regulator/effector-binding domain-containing protein [Streptosporangium becharense]|uniref:DNA-binding transcriptional MerR regulator/effector-binding domain-containing protein n=1 Tax=Streptosporangium becharense TaxID=1816182 RepID=A0A7W9IAL9_9ACTN|nr:MerR family transcriptional regulator [Streptosporangium becharense]MBB2914203.1 DNA-binding transcriptional MerR regulator/effector-binding domain-containing protein [Streptosporangium becharense]MBB5817230.1 DNA-binding transcriptional MerR regulator/effector-binding domain-containing protein [Streptosporangium becharense]
MLSIGEFASIGRVSIRMLRHYDSIGLLTPARVDPSSGYRFYDDSQFAALDHILALKDLGLRLEAITRVVRGEVDGEELYELLAARRAELAAQIERETACLRRLDARLRQLEGESPMSEQSRRLAALTVEVKSLPPLRVARATATAGGFGPAAISPVIGPLFDRLYRSVADAGVHVGPTSVATYGADTAGDGSGVIVTAGFPVGPDVVSGDGFEVVELPAVESAATTVHRGSMATIGGTWEALHQWTAEQGYGPDEVCREFYLVAEPDPQENWVTELQLPITRR